MANQLDDAYQRVLDNLPPDDWKIVEMVNGSEGWRVSAARVWYNQPGAPTLWPRIDAMAGNLTKALNRLADRLEEHNAKSTKE